MLPKADSKDELADLSGLLVNVSHLFEGLDYLKARRRHGKVTLSFDGHSLAVSDGRKAARAEASGSWPGPCRCNIGHLFRVVSFIRQGQRSLRVLPGERAIHFGPLFVRCDWIEPKRKGRRQPPTPASAAEQLLQKYYGEAVGIEEVTTSFLDLLARTGKLRLADLDAHEKTLLALVTADAPAHSLPAAVQGLIDALRQAMQVHDPSGHSERPKGNS